MSNEARVGRKLSAETPAVREAISENNHWARESLGIPLSSTAFLVVPLALLYQVMRAVTASPKGALVSLQASDATDAYRVLVCSNESAQIALGISSGRLPNVGGPYLVVLDVIAPYASVTRVDWLGN